MHDIEAIINDTRKKMIPVCGGKGHKPVFGELCVICERKAVTSAYVEAVIPEGYRRLTIEDFTGTATVNGKEVRMLADDVVISALKQITDYCWRDIEEGEPYSRFEWGKRSIMDDRMTDGSNVVIYGNPVSKIRGGKLLKKPLGKTMIAAIIMKEAIGRKMYDGHLGDRFEWVGFELMTKRLLEQAKGDRSHDDEIDDWEESDWLVVDGITFNDKSEGGRQFRANVLDKLFVERVEKRRPSILVFQDDIEKCEDLRLEFGSEIAKIITGRKTVRICVNALKED